jgi:radical SAM protein with 4Fe4S-binding SPASM domain
LSDAIYVLPVASRRLVYSPARGVAAVVSASAVPPLARWVRDAAVGGGASLPAGLGPLEEALRAAPATVERPAWPPFLGLIVTRGCTMACRYCDFGGHEAALGAMPPAIAVAAIDAWAEQLRQQEAPELNLHFFGGEPFTVPGLVEVAVHRTRALAASCGMRTHFEASTNGLLQGATLEFAADYFDTLVVSLDGRPEEQERHRPLASGQPGFPLVHAALQRLRDSPVEICLRCCVSRANQHALGAIAEWFIAEYQPAVIDFEPMQLPAGATVPGLTPPDPVAFAQGFLAARRIAEAAGVECVYSVLHDPLKQGFCPVDQQALIVAPDGSIRCCYLPAERWTTRGLDLELGRVGPGAGWHLDSAALQRVAGLSARRAACRNCFCWPGCGGGCLLQDQGSEDAAGYTAFCRQNRLMQACVLLDDLGAPEAADALASDPAARDALLRQTTDRLM